MKADVPSYPKMWYFLGLAVFKVGLLAAEAGSKFKKKMMERWRQKKRHGQIFDFRGFNNIVDKPFNSFRPYKSKL